MSSAERFSKVERLKRELSIAEHEEQIEQLRAELEQVEEPRPIVEEAKPVEDVDYYRAVEKQDTRRDNRLITEQHDQIVQAANSSLQKPTKGNRPKRENVYREQIPFESVSPLQHRKSPTSFEWFTEQDILKWMQKSELNSFKYSLPVKELSQAWCADIKHEWTETLRNSVGRKLLVLEEEGLVEKKSAVKTQKRVPILPKDIDEDEEEDAPVVLKYHTIGINAHFWFLTKKGLTA
tara:strand:+ start:1959 stop:2666 length:708 start_codon:yes stop_codon:yes gene_type:complete